MTRGTCRAAHGLPSRALVLTAVLATTALVESFAPAPLKTSPVGSALHLVPSQGKQLEAAWNAAYATDDEEEHPHRKTTTEEERITPTSAARAFVSRLFSLPSHLHRREQDNDVVYYPIVGFRWVPCDKDGSRVLPTTSTASIRIPPVNEDVVGWFSPACPLGSSFTEDKYGAPEEFQHN